MKLDAINTKILSELSKNARASFTEIGAKVGLSSSSVAERVKKLEDTGIIEKYQIRLSYFNLGYQLKAIITLKAFAGKLKPFLASASGFKEIIRCYRITGNENIIMEVILNDHKHLERFIDQLIAYGETKTHIILSEVELD